MQKNSSKKHLIFEKWDIFENWQKSPSHKGHSLCKMITLGQKLKIPKTSRKTLYKHIRVILCQKQLIFEKSHHFENLQKWPLHKGYSLWKMVTLGQKLKVQKKMQKNTLQAYYSYSMQKTAPKKQLIFEKSHRFEKFAKMATAKRL